MNDADLDAHVYERLNDRAPSLAFFIAWGIFEGLALGETPWLCSTNQIVPEVEASLRRLVDKGRARTPDGQHWYRNEES